MIARAFRLAVILVILAALLLLFFYAFLAALIVTPIILVLFLLFGRRVKTRFWTVQAGADPWQRRGREGQGPVIDHDPDALGGPGKDELRNTEEDRS